MKKKIINKPYRKRKFEEKKKKIEKIKYHRKKFKKQQV